MNNSLHLEEVGAFSLADVCEALRERASGDQVTRWIRTAALTVTSESTVEIAVGNTMAQIWIEENYSKELREAVIQVAGRPMSVRVVVRNHNFIPAEPAQEEEPEERPEPIERPEVPARHSVSAGPTPDPKTGLNSRFTFEGYVVGDSNKSAAAVARAVAKSPARSYNPLFIFGGTGLGKTHLLHAIGNELKTTRPNCRVLYTTSESFVNDFVDALQHQALSKFRRRYRSLDALMIDDVQFLAGKEKSEEEFFHTFNSLTNSSAQIVLASDRPASEMRMLTQRLVSRFEQGMTASLLPPDTETRIAILRKKMDAMHVKLSDEVVRFIASRIKSNVRRLEGALTCVAVYASLVEGELTIAEAESRLREFLQEEARDAPTIDKIQRMVADVFDIRNSDMTSKKRPARIALPRQVAMYLCRRLTDHSLQEIGSAFGGRDHGTVHHACSSINDKVGKDSDLRLKVERLEQELRRE